MRKHEKTTCFDPNQSDIQYAMSPVLISSMWLQILRICSKSEMLKTWISGLRILKKNQD